VTLESRVWADSTTGGPLKLDTNGKVFGRSAYDVHHSRTYVDSPVDQTPRPSREAAVGHC